MHTAQALMLQVGGIKMTIFILPVKQNKFSTIKIPNWVNLGKLCNASNIRDCLMSQKLGVENPMIIQKTVTHSNKKRVLMLIWIMICRIHNNCLKCCVLVLKFYACLSSNCFKVLCLSWTWYGYWCDHLLCWVSSNCVKILHLWIAWYG